MGSLPRSALANGDLGRWLIGASRIIRNLNPLPQPAPPGTQRCSLGQRQWDPSLVLLARFEDDKAHLSGHDEVQALASNTRDVGRILESFLTGLELCDLSTPGQDLGIHPIDFGALGDERLDRLCHRHNGQSKNRQTCSGTAVESDATPAPWTLAHHTSVADQPLNRGNAARPA
jgi:hypothetical protein